METDSSLYAVPTTEKDEVEEEEDEVQKAIREKNEMELYYAIDRDDPEKLQRILDRGYDPNSVFSGLDPMGRPLCWYPLHFCCEKGRYDCARALFRAGADPDVGDRWCMTPLMYAVQREWHNMVELMLSCGASVDLQDTKGRTPMHLAIECTDTKCIQILRRFNASLNIVDRVGRIPLWIAVTKDGRVDHVKEIIEYSAIDLPDERDHRTPLQEAIVYAEKDRVEYVRLLLAAGCDVNHRDEANLNSVLNLLYICRRRGKGVTSDDLAIATALLEAGYNLNEVAPRTRWYKFGGTAIKMAAEQGATELVKLFLSRGADPNKADDCNITPLLIAAYNCHLETVIALIDANSKLDTIGELKINHVYCQVTPLQAAMIRGHFTIARLLVECGSSMKTERYLFDGANVPQQLVEDCDFWRWLIEQASNPASLFDICIRQIRVSIGLNTREKLESIPLPSCLKHSVLLVDQLQNN